MVVFPVMKDGGGAQGMRGMEVIESWLLADDRLDEGRGGYRSTTVSSITVDCVLEVLGCASNEVTDGWRSLRLLAVTYWDGALAATTTVVVRHITGLLGREDME